MGTQQRTEAALDAMIYALNQGPEATDRGSGLGRLLDHLSSQESSPNLVSPSKREFKRQNTSKAMLSAMQRDPFFKEYVDPYTNAIWRPNTASIEPASWVRSRERKSAAAAARAAEAATSAAAVAAAAEPSAIEPELERTLRDIAVASSPRPPLPPWDPFDTHMLIDSIMKCSVRSASSGRLSPLMRGSPRRSPDAITRHQWSGWSREQSIEAATLMHSPGHLRGYTRELAYSARHRHRDFMATPYSKVAAMYPGGDNPASDTQAINFMKGLHTVKTAPRKLSPRSPDRRAKPRLCTRFQELNRTGM